MERRVPLACKPHNQYVAGCSPTHRDVSEQSRVTGKEYGSVSVSLSILILSSHLSNLWTKNEQGQDMITVSVVERGFYGLTCVLTRDGHSNCWLTYKLHLTPSRLTTYEHLTSSRLGVPERKCVSVTGAKISAAAVVT